jgi:hypothetical protein
MLTSEDERALRAEKEGLEEKISRLKACEAELR